MKQVKWGIIGLGGIASKFANGFQFTKNARLFAISSKNENKLLEFKNKFQIDENYCFSNYDSLLECKDLDMVYIALPHSFHHEWVIKSIKKEKNILVEKPATVNFLQMENIKNNLWILDPYFGSKGFSLLNSAVEQNSEINEIRIITDMKKLVSYHGMHPIDKVREFRSHINRFNTAFRGKTAIQMIISSEFTEKNESNYHDRFLISQERVWNFTSSDQVYTNTRVDIQKLEDQETIDNDLKMFKKLWNGEKIHKIYFLQIKL